MTQMNLSMKQKQTHRLVVARGKGMWGGMGWEFGTSRCKLVHIGWINQPGPTV